MDMFTDNKEDHCMADDLTPEGKSVATGTRMADLMQHYAETVHAEGGEAETLLTDILADLRHWARYEAIDFDACADRAEMHYSAEEPGDEDA